MKINSFLIYQESLPTTTFLKKRPRWVTPNFDIKEHLQKTVVLERTQVKRSSTRVTSL